MALNNLQGLICHTTQSTTQPVKGYFMPWGYRIAVIEYSFGGARGVMVIVTGYGHGNPSSIPGQDWLHFT